jgi:hypothetical protein
MVEQKVLKQKTIKILPKTILFLTNLNVAPNINNVMIFMLTKRKIGQFIGYVRGSYLMKEIKPCTTLL